MTGILKVGNSAAVTWSANEAVVSASDGNPKHSLTAQRGKSSSKIKCNAKVGRGP